MLRDTKATCLHKIISEKRWNADGLKTLIKKLIALALSDDYQVAGDRNRATCTSVAVHVQFSQL